MRAAVFCGVAWLASALVHAQGATGPEIEAFATSDPFHEGLAGDEREPFATDAAAGPEGTLLIVSSAVLPGSVVEARLFDAFGVLVHGPFTVGSFPAGNWAPSVARINGGFVVVWQSLDPKTPIYGRLLDDSGAPVGSEFRVSDDLPGSLATSGPIVRSAPDGRFVVAWFGQIQWGGGDIWARRYSAAAVPQGTAVHINLSTAYDVGSPFSNRPGLALASDGSFVAAWRSPPLVPPFPGGPLATEIVVARVRADGMPLFRSEIAAGGPPSVASAPDGSFLVTMVDGLSEVEVGAFSPSGGRLAPWASVSRLPPGFPTARRPTAIATSDGAFTVVWEAWWSGAHPAAFGRNLNATGGPSGPVFRIGVHDARYLNATSDGAGGLAAFWHTWGRPGLPFSGVVLRHYAPLAPSSPLAVADPAAGPQSDGNWILDPGETVAFRSAWSNSGESAVSLSGEALAFTGPSARYTITDAGAAYVVPGGGRASCAAAGDCYGLQLGRTVLRPAGHWDALLDERLGTGQVQRWRVHVGGTFTDVPRTSPWYRYVEALAHNEVMSGCGPRRFCPEHTVTREEVTLFLLLAREGAHYAPDRTVATPTFNDVPADNPFSPFIEELFYRGVLYGCDHGAYCPTQPITRVDLARMALRTLDLGFVPPSCTTPLFSDVPASGIACRWVEEMARRGIMGGCGGGRFCPDDPVSKAELALVLSRTFELTAAGF